MSLTNTDEEYGAIARVFHWAIALIIFGLVPVGLYMGTLAYGPDKLELYLLHKSFGFLALFLVIGRIIWRVIGIPPEHLPTHARWERNLAGMAHAFLYVAMVGMPMSGWIMSSAAEYPVPFFGFTMPNLVGKSETIYTIASATHEYLAYGLIVAVGLHIAGAFKHHFIDKDTTLMRMIFMKNRVGVAIALIVAIVFFAMVVRIFLMPKSIEEAPAQTQTAVTQRVAGEPNLANLAENGWAIVPGISMIEFKVSMGGTPFTGSFDKFDGTIIFDPNNLEASKADITIDTTSATTSNAERDAQIGSPEWFNTTLWPTAHFQTLTFEKGVDNNYIAVGNLTIRDVTLPVTVPFTLEFGQNKDGQKTATMKGRAEINRLDFGIGQGQWTTEDTIAGPVAVALSVTAVQP